LACSRALALAAALLLLAAPAARAHVTPAPAFVEQGESATISFEVLNERAGHATVALELTPPPGVEIEPEAPPPGWSASREGSGVRWSDGRITGADALRFDTRVTASARAGSYAFTAVQRYEDGATVDWKAAFTVLPATGEAAPDEHAGRALVAGAIGLAVVVASLLGLHLVRRRRALQDQ